MTNLAKSPTEELVVDLQCPGCTNGSGLECGKYRRGTYGQCAGHSCGTFMGGAGQIALGFPKGFCRPGFVLDEKSHLPPLQTSVLRTWSIRGIAVEVAPAEDYSFDRFNVPVGRGDWQGKPMVLVSSPRTNRFTAVLYDKPLTTEEEKVLADVIRLGAEALGEGPSPARLVSIDFKRPFDVRFWVNGEKPVYTAWNVATWALERDGLLFVRVCNPLAVESWVDVVAGGKLDEIAPRAIDVSKFIDEID